MALKPLRKICEYGKIPASGGSNWGYLQKYGQQQTLSAACFNCPMCHPWQGPDHTVDTVGLMDLLCLTKVGQYPQISPP